MKRINLSFVISTALLLSVSMSLWGGVLPLGAETSIFGNAAAQSDGVSFVSAAAKQLTIEKQLASIEGKFKAVWGYDALQHRWRGYFPSEPPFANDLVRLDVGKAYWINAMQKCTLEYGGWKYVLYKGWNTIGWLGEESPQPKKTDRAVTAAGGCFIATAAYGTPMAQEINVLRQFRDEYLLSNPVGRIFVSLYYGSSPPFAHFIESNPVVKPLVRVGLLPTLYLSKMAVDTAPAQKIAVAGGLALICLMLFLWMRRQRSA